MVNIFKYLYTEGTLKRKILDIIDDIKILVKETHKVKFSIDWYGAYDIDPQHLIIMICVKSDETKSRIQSNQELFDNMRGVFKEYNYPEQAIPFVHLCVESQETVDRESNGNWYVHLK